MAHRLSREQNMPLSPTLQRQLAALNHPATSELPSPTAPHSLNGQVGMGEGEDVVYDMLEYAEKFYNQHERDAGGTIMKSLKKRRQSLNDVLSKEEMLRYCKSGLIPTSHVRLHDLENINLACSLFKEMTRFLREEVQEDGGLATVQHVVRSGIERIELRDEIFCQLVRQTNENPDSEGLVNAWVLLALCTAAFNPSKTLHKYLLSYIKKNCSDAHVGKYALMCHTHLTIPRATARRHPPSATEFMSSKLLSPIICKVYFMDGKTKATHVQSIDTTADVMEKVARRIGLKSIEGWAIYEVTKVYERFVRSHEYVADIMAQWEQQEQLVQTPSKGDTMSRKGPRVTMGNEDAKLVFRKRVYRHVHDIPNDPMEYHLLYAEAVHKVVRSDEFSVSEKVALQLAGLQAQVIWGDFEDDKVFRYSEAEQYLCKRILASSGRNWSQEVAKAHQHYGSKKSELEAKVWYLTCVKQFPLYGCTLFPIIHKGLWSHTQDALLAINMDGVKFMRAKDKSIIHDFRYSDIETISIDANENYITLELRNTAQSQCQQKSFLFATIHKEDIGHLIASYSPHHASWMKPELEGMKKMKMSDEEKLKLYEELVRCRKALAESRLLQRPQHDTNSGFFRNTLRRLTKTKMDKLRSSAAGDSGMFGVDYWSYSKSGLRQSLTVIPDPSIEETAIKMFTSILIYTGVEEAVWNLQFSPDSEPGQAEQAQESWELVQALMLKCLNNDHLCNEFYLQLIKQTTDHPDYKKKPEPNSLVNKRSWQLLAVAACTLAPVNSRVLKYLQVHLKKCSMDTATEEGMFARFCHKCLLKTMEKKRRKFPPSSKEIQCIISRRPITEKMYLLTGEYRIVEFDSAATCVEVIKTVKAKIGMRLDAECFAIYEVVGGTERSMSSEERLSDTLSKWERLSRSGTSREVRLVFKKHLFLEPYVNSNDPVECDLVFHQLMEDVFEHRLPLTHQDAVRLCAYKVQTEIEDMKSGDIDYNSVLRILPRAVRPSVRVEEVAALHKSVLELTPQQAVLGFLAVLQAWPLFGAAVFPVSQSYTTMLPKTLLLAVGQTGLDLLDINTFSVITHHHFSEIVYFSPANKSIKSIMIVVGHVAKGTKFMFNTNQAYQIAHLIKDYVEELQGRYLLMPSDHANRMSRALDLDLDLPPPPPPSMPPHALQPCALQI